MVIKPLGNVLHTSLYFNIPYRYGILACFQFENDRKKVQIW